MTQLIIDGHEAVLPKNFSCTVKRENSFFTKSGEYTYDVTLRLDNQVNRELYDFLQRINKSDDYRTNRPAVLVADGHLYCRGTEIVTRWTDETVTIQIVSGESELNYFIGQDRKIEELNLGEADNTNCVYPVVRTTAGGLMNYQRLFRYENIEPIFKIYRRTFLGGEYRPTIPSPLLCPLLSGIIASLGYTVRRNDLENTFFRNLFILNCRNTTDIAKMLEGWTVKDFLGEIEKLTGVVFVTDNSDPEHPTCDIIIKQIFYNECRQLTIHNVTDAYEADVADDEGRDAEFSTSDVGYDLPDHFWTNLMRIPEGLPVSTKTLDYPSLDDIKRDTARLRVDGHAFLRDTSTGRLYVIGEHNDYAVNGDEITTKCLFEVDQFADLDREGTASRLEVGITPAPMAYLGWPHDTEVIDLGSNDGYDGHSIGWNEIVDKARAEEGDEEEWETVEDDMVEEKSTFVETVRSAQKKETSAGDLYCAFWGGYTTIHNTPIVYTDAYHAATTSVGAWRPADFENLDGSLRLKDLDEGYFQGGYLIDTKHPITIETYDPNVIDPRQVYVILNKRFVCRDVEEVVTAEGRQPKWRGTFYPITITDEALEKRWVLTNGTWDDGAAWLDDGRWNDGPGDPSSQTPAVDPGSSQGSGSEPSPDPGSEPSQGTEPDSLFTYVIDAFDNVTIPEGGVTYHHLLDMYEEAKSQFYDGRSLNSLPLLYAQNNFPTVYNYYGSTQQRQQAFQKMVAWIFAMTLTELKPSARNAFYMKAYDLWGAGKQIPTYQHRFDSDTNVARLVGSAIYATMRDATKISAMRTEVGGSTISYASSSYEILVDTRLFMPQAPGPYLNDHDVNSRQGATPRYGESPGGYPVGEANADHNLVKDKQVYDYVVATYNLSSANADIRQRTVQAIADKEYENPHLFGSSRTVTDPTYGTLTFNPVFGAHNLGVTISTSGAIANLVSAVVADCSRTRETLLHQQYGRRRPGQGATDGSAKSNSQERALVNFTIEEGDGHTTGYYNQNGDYVKRSDNSHIGDYVDYFQRQLSANSYPSGHSAYIWGVALILMEVMPDKADKIMKAANDFALSRVIARYHWTSDTIHGRVIGSVMIPVEHALTNVNYASLLAAAKQEYQALT